MTSAIVKQARMSFMCHSALRIALSRTGPIVVAAVALGLSACAPMIVSQPAELTAKASPSSTRAIRFNAPAEILAGFGSRRTIDAGSRWLYSGTLPQGAVYRPVDTVFTIQSRHAHEAYLVVKNNVLVGFFLPGESSFSPLTPTLQLDLGENQ
jgi:hypothetical protein